jgi:hypothetical protein
MLAALNDILTHSNVFTLTDTTVLHDARTARAQPVGHRMPGLEQGLNVHVFTSGQSDHMNMGLDLD